MLNHVTKQAAHKDPGMDDFALSAGISNEEAGMLCTACFWSEEDYLLPVDLSRCMECSNAEKSHDDTRAAFSYMRFFLSFLLRLLTGYLLVSLCS